MILMLWLLTAGVVASIAVGKFENTEVGEET
jgi:hypothetical protein